MARHHETVESGAAALQAELTALKDFLAAKDLLRSLKRNFPETFERYKNDLHDVIAQPVEAEEPASHTEGETGATPDWRCPSARASTYKLDPRSRESPIGRDLRPAKPADDRRRCPALSNIR